jgi:hypothetical protein
MNGNGRPRITLNEQEQRIARWMGKQRNEVCQRLRFPNTRITPHQSSEVVNVNGYGAEMALCKQFNLYPDFDITPRRGTADCCSHFGETIDVKATQHQHGRLLAVHHKQLLAADTYVLMIVDWPDFSFTGYALASELLTPERLKDLGHGPTYGLEQHLLRGHR